MPSEERKGKFWLKRIVNIFRWVIGLLLLISFALAVIFTITDAERPDATGLLYSSASLILGLLITPPTFIFLKKHRWIAILILVILVISNPSLSSFRNFAKDIDDSKTTIFKKKSNYFIFSIYEKEWPITGNYQRQSQSEYYIGFLGNFFEWYIENVE